MPSSDAEAAGQFIGAILLALLPCYFLVRALRAKERSLRLANWALALGLLAFFMPERMLELNPTSNPIYYVVSGVLRLVASLSGIALAILALAARRRDQGTGYVRPILGVLACMANLGMAAFALFFSLYPRLEGPPWTFTAAAERFSIVLPSSRWEKFPETPKNHVAAFAHRVAYPMRFLVSVETTEKDEDWALMREARWKELSGASVLAPWQIEEEVTPQGQPCWTIRTECSAAKGEGRFFFSLVLIWLKDRKEVVSLMFEGPYRSQSTAGRQAEEAWFREQVRKIAISVK